MAVVFLKNLDKESPWNSHRGRFVEAYCRNFYWVEPHFLESKEVESLLSRAQELEKSGLLRPAAVGKGVKKKRVTHVRSDEIFWLEDFSSASGHLIQKIFTELQSIARQEFYLPAKRFECHFAKYDHGSFYKKHRDRHQKKPGRLLTCVLYLSECAKGEGGELVLWDNEGCEHRIRPQPGKIVIFDSSFEHEVTKSLVERWSLTGWVRSDLHTNIRI